MFTVSCLFLLPRSSTFDPGTLDPDQASITRNTRLVVCPPPLPLPRHCIREIFARITLDRLCTDNTKFREPILTRTFASAYTAHILFFRVTFFFSFVEIKEHWNAENEIACFAPYWQWNIFEYNVTNREKNIKPLRRTEWRLLQIIVPCYPRNTKLHAHVHDFTIKTKANFNASLRARRL